MNTQALSAEHVAPLLGMAPSTLRSRLAATTALTVEDLINLGAVLAVPVSDLLPPDPNRRTR